jgi:malate dehydrogenase (oxaloacetate-decarboxylating)
MSGAGAAGTAILKLLMDSGAQDVVVCDSRGVVCTEREDLVERGGELVWIAEHTNPRGVRGSLKDAVVGADVFVGVSAGGLLDGADIAGMAKDAIVFAMANPDPEVDPNEASRHAAVVATGRSDFANQINNVLAFPGVFRGLLDARAKSIPEEVLLAAANALAGTVSDAELNAAYIVPSVFHPDVTKVVAAAVQEAALKAGAGERRPADSEPHAASG